jgi:hypothetical protein
MRCDVTMLELVTAVTEHTGTEGEAIATIVHMVNSGAVRLCGTFSGARIDLGEVDQPWVPAAETERRGSSSRGRERLRRQQENPSKPWLAV